MGERARPLVFVSTKKWSTYKQRVVSGILTLSLSEASDRLRHTLQRGALADRVGTGIATAMIIAASGVRQAVVAVGIATLLPK
jgi:hypothetical protein